MNTKDSYDVVMDMVMRVMPPLPVLGVVGVRRMVAVLTVLMVVVMPGVVVFLEEIGVDVQLGVEVEAAQVEHIVLDGDFAEVARWSGVRAGSCA